MGVSTIGEWFHGHISCSIFVAQKAQLYIASVVCGHSIASMANCSHHDRSCIHYFLTFSRLFIYLFIITYVYILQGLIKLRGDKCWLDLTCMNYHYETQPVPNPISYFMHQEPEIFHKFETLVNHFVELVAPFLILIPIRACRITGGLIQIIFQVVFFLICIIICIFESAFIFSFIK